MVSRLLILVTVGLLTAAPTLADELTGNVEEKSQYEVELLVFRNEAALAGQPDGGSAPMVPAADPQVRTAPAPQIAPLRPQDLRLGSVRAKLERMASHEIILHYGWSQELQTEHTALGVSLPSDPAKGGLSGVVTAYRGRFLHVALDLQLPASDSTTGKVRLRQSRRVKPGVLQYFDNPQFGAIVVLRPAGGSALSDPNG